MLVKNSFEEYFDDLKESVYQALIRDYSFVKKPEINLLKFSENITCLVTENEHKYVLQINRIGYHNDEELESELLWMQELAGQLDIEIATVYKGEDGELLHYIDSPKGNKYRYSVQSFVKGESLRKMSGDKLYEQMQQLGKITAKLHLISEKRTESKEKLKTFTWDIEDTLSENSRWGYYLELWNMSIEEKSFFEKVNTKIKDRLLKYGRNATNYGLIHADLHSENILIDGENIAVIDFDDCGYSWFLYDFASAVSQFVDNIDELKKSFLKGYESIRKLKEIDKEMIDDMILLRRLVRMGWMISHKDNGVFEREGERYYKKTYDMAKKYLESK